MYIMQNYPNQISREPRLSQRIRKLSTHFRRMKTLPEIKSPLKRQSLRRVWFFSKDLAKLINRPRETFCHRTRLRSPDGPLIFSRVECSTGETSFSVVSAGAAERGCKFIELLSARSTLFVEFLWETPSLRRRWNHFVRNRAAMLLLRVIVGGSNVPLNKISLRLY